MRQRKIIKSQIFLFILISERMSCPVKTPVQYMFLLALTASLSTYF